MTTAINCQSLFISATVTATDYPTRIRGVKLGNCSTKGEHCCKVR